MEEVSMSASRLGRQIGASGVEMNRLLAEAGVLSGSANAYSLTEVGQKYATVESHRSNSTQNNRTYNRYWDTRTFHPSVMELLTDVPEMLAKIRAELKVERQAKSIADRLARDQADAEFLAAEAAKAIVQAGARLDPKKLALGGGIVVAGTAVVVGVKWGIESVQLRKRERAAIARAEARRARAEAERAANPEAPVS